MSDFIAAVNILRARLQSEFTALPLRWPNDNRDASLKSAPDGFVYSEARNTDEGPASIGPDGSRRHRDRGEFAVYVYVPRGTLAGAAEAHAAAIRTAFAVSRVSDVVITRRTIGAGRTVEGPDGRLWCIPVTIEFFSDRLE